MDDYLQEKLSLAKAYIDDAIMDDSSVTQKAALYVALQILKETITEL